MKTISRIALIVLSMSGAMQVAASAASMETTPAPVQSDSTASWANG